MQPKKINSLKDIADSYGTFFIDMYGVIFNGLNFYSQVAPLFLDLKNKAKKLQYYPMRRPSVHVS